MMFKGCARRVSGWWLRLGFFLTAMAVSQSYETTSTSTSTSTGFCVGSYCNKQTTTTTNYNNGYTNGYSGNSNIDDNGDSDNVGFGTMIFLAVLLVVIQGLCILHHCSKESAADSRTLQAASHKAGVVHHATPRKVALHLATGPGADDDAPTTLAISAVASAVAFAMAPEAPLDSKV
jgi:hypothetical protein